LFSFFQNPLGMRPPLNHAGVLFMAVVKNNQFCILKQNVIYCWHSSNLTNLLWNKNKHFESIH
jgi:hypothetical protein